MTMFVHLSAHHQMHIYTNVFSNLSSLQSLLISNSKSYTGFSRNPSQTPTMAQEGVTRIFSLKHKGNCKRYIPVWLSIEQSTAWMNIDNLRVDQCPITFLRILLGRVTEEAAQNRLLYSGCVLTARHNVQLVSTQTQQHQSLLHTTVNVRHQQSA